MTTIRLIDHAGCEALCLDIGPQGPSRALDRTPVCGNDRLVYAPTDMARHGILLAGADSAQKLVRAYGSWAHRKVHLYKSPQLRDLSSALDSLLIVAPPGHEVWERALALVADGYFEAGPALLFLPFASEDDLRDLLCVGALTAQTSSSSAFTGHEPSDAIPLTSIDAITLHARPYCGRVGEGEGLVALCSSPLGDRAECYSGHGCAFQNIPAVPVGNLAAPLVFLNGCSTAFPPIARLPYPPETLLGYRLMRSGATIVLGNLGLGPASAWESQYVQQLLLSGGTIVDAITRLNRARRLLGNDRLFRVVGFGDAALWSGRTRSVGGVSASIGASVAITWKGAQRSVFARVPKTLLDLEAHSTGLALHLVRGLDPSSIIRVDDDDDSVFFAARQSSRAARPKVLLGPRSDQVREMLQTLRETIDGVSALVARSEIWNLRPALVSMSDAIYSASHLEEVSRVYVPTLVSLSALEQSIRSIIRGASSVVMGELIGLLRRSMVDLGELYRGDEMALDDRAKYRVCPLCNVPGSLTTRMLGVSQVRSIVQLKCPICAMAYQSPVGLDIARIRVDAATPGIAIAIAIRNRGPFPVALSYKWHAEETLVDGRLTHERLNDRFRTVVIPPASAWRTSKAFQARFLRAAQFYFVANAVIGFVQIKDAEVARGRTQLLASR